MCELKDRLYFKWPKDADIYVTMVNLYKKKIESESCGYIRGIYCLFTGYSAQYCGATVTLEITGKRMGLPAMGAK